ncbi:MAG: hypothetical protein LCH38_09385 [Proteobacteria bacterium]|nr:hypothetical protein [Pseudomonadota bacterium]
MRALFLALFALVGAVMGYFMLQSECPGGKAFASEAECRAAAGFDAAFCRAGFALAHRKAIQDYAPFSTQNDCLQAFARCQPHAVVVGGYVPVPEKVCIARDQNGTAKGEPLYTRIGSGASQR